MEPAQRYHHQQKVGPKPVMTPAHFMLVCGSLMLFLVVIIPMWEANRLLQDPTFVFFVGGDYCTSTILVCLLMIVVYAVMIMLLFGCARDEGKTQQNVFVVATTVITILGLALLLISQPLKFQSKAAYEEIFFRCNTGPRSQRLMEYSTVLQTLRTQSDCQTKLSVELCDGYQESQPYTGFLKEIESMYKCSGFCYGNGSLVAAMAPLLTGSESSASLTTPAPALLGMPSELSERSVSSVHEDQAKAGLAKGRVSSGLVGALQQLAHRRSQQADDQGLALMQAYAVASPMRMATTSVGMVGTEVYPQTLFTDANYQASCDGMAARALRYKAMEAADLLYYEGVSLVFCAIAVMFLQVAGMCTNLKRLTEPSRHYPVNYS